MINPVTMATGCHRAPKVLEPAAASKKPPSSIRHGDGGAVRCPSSTDAAPSRLQGLRHSAAIAAVLAAMVLAVLDTAISNVALPTMARSLQVSPALSVWIITAYQTALVMGLLPCAARAKAWAIAG